MQRLVTLAALTLALALPAAAAAAPDRTVVLDAAAPEHAWDGEQGNYTNLQYDPAECSKDANSYCEQILLDVRSGGPVKLEGSLTEFSFPFADFDIYVYMSDAAGVPGEQVDAHAFSYTDPSAPGYGGPPGIEEFYIVESLEPGYYLLVVSHFLTMNATYKGNVKVTGATPVAGAPTPPSGGGGGGGTTPPSGGGGGGTPPPSGGGSTPGTASGPMSLPFSASKSLGSFKKAKRKKFFSLKVTAGQEITNLVTRLTKAGSSKVLAQAKVRRLKAGKSTLKLRLRTRKMRKGRYNLVTTGIVNGQRASKTQTVTVKR